MRKGVAAGGAVAASPLISFLHSHTVQRSDLPAIDLPITALPSLNETIALLIRAGQFDEKNGIVINFVPRPLGPALNDYRSGRSPLNAAATIIHEADHLNRGVPSSIVFCTFAYYSTVLTADSSIRTLKDLEEKTLGANTVSGMYSMFDWFARREGANLRRENIQSLGIPALVPTLLAGRVDAIHCWEPAASIAEHRNPGKYHRIEYAHKWKQYTGFDLHPFLNVAAHRTWADAHQDLLPRMFQAYRDASEFLYSRPQEGVRMIAQAVEGQIPTPVLEKIVRGDTLRFHPFRVQDVRRETEAVFRAMVETGRLDRMPDPDVVYQWDRPA